jgi:hypothetical protein
MKKKSMNQRNKCDILMSLGKENEHICVYILLHELEFSGVPLGLAKFAGTKYSGNLHAHEVVSD